MTHRSEKRFLLNNLPRAEALRAIAAFAPTGVTEDTLTAITAYNAVMETSSALLHHLNAKMSTYGLTQARFRMLFRIYAEPGGDGISPCKLADILKVERATITSLIDGLEKDGLVRRQTSPEDRRYIKVVLTQSGKDIINTLTPKRLRYMLNLMGTLSPSECRTLVSMLDKLNRRLEEMKD